MPRAATASPPWSLLSTPETGYIERARSIPIWLGVWVREGAWCGVGESWELVDGGGVRTRRELARLKSAPRRSCTGGASRAGGQGVHEGWARRADERTGGLGREEGEQEVALERVGEADVRRRVVRLSVEMQEDGSRVRRR